MGADYSVEKPIIFFDGVCNLCNSSVLFVIKRDPKEKFLFASLQSKYAQENLPSTFTGEDSIQSIVLKQRSGIKTKSSAALTIAKNISGGWPIMYAFIIIPKFLRDWVYDIIAKNRYKWFGKKDQCMIPSPELKSRFLD
ncbi:Predicted thiol-disulfide oxidoreductase YuxK, DCC family [Ekhidna lutea]|uniref:Predicted thiol-disulfide oxidoreductase YuxK, DCC family n=1 Tax=Ekhidna lutea TaxID=447679 RepID=A0A239L3V0_EKHLU|nr:DCC1-like thiol-disulfide oxidoreductase family protein [Ekhidna lutea]SNT24598.1 Predicted thiol-disulfide oxidoreductase YuxK, DCC family [Ekhidna lutea]